MSLGLSLVLMWGGRDKVWTPTFEGTRAERFERAVRHYEAKMGLGAATIMLSDTGRVIGGKARCAWAWREDGWSDDVIGFWTSAKCERHKPEVLAFHEACHRRWAHLEPAMWDLPREQKEREVKACMVAYSAKERR